MKLTVNGQTIEAPPNPTVRALIETMGLQGRAVAVEVNQEVVPKRRHDQATLHEGDKVEIVTLVGGG